MLADTARDLVVLAVGGSYLEVIAAKARIDSARAQLQTEEAQCTQASEQRAGGVLALTDLNRSEVQVLTTGERIASLENDYAKQKINLARLTGLSPTDHFELTDSIPFSAAPALDQGKSRPGKRTVAHPCSGVYPFCCPRRAASVVVFER